MFCLPEALIYNLDFKWRDFQSKIDVILKTTLTFYFLFCLYTTQLLVKVIESERASSLIWEKSNYTGIISEQESDFRPVTTLRVVLPPREDDVDDSDGDSDQRENNWRKRSSDSSAAASTSVGTILYGFHNAEDSRSLEIFSIDTLSGLVSIAKPSLIDRESLPRHVLTVKARDPIHFYMFTRLVIVVEDTNDHAPDWRYSVTELRIPETTAVGSLISQVTVFQKYLLRVYVVCRHAQRNATSLLERE